MYFELFKLSFHWHMFTVLTTQLNFYAVIILFETMTCFSVTWTYFSTYFFENGTQLFFQFITLNTIKNTHHLKTFSSGILGVCPAHYLSISSNLFDRTELACFATEFSTSSWLNFWFNLLTSSRMSFCSDSTFFWSGNRIVISFLLFNLLKASSV